MRNAVYGLVLISMGACGHRENVAATPAGAPVAKDPIDQLLHDAQTRASKPFRFAGTSSESVTEDGTQVEKLDETTAIDSAAEGAVHATYLNSKDYGRELYASGGTVWVRPRYGKFHERPAADPDEANRVTGEIYGTLAADLELVAPYLKLSAGEATPGSHKLVLSLAGAKTTRPGAHGWRDEAVVQSLDGEITIDDATHMILSGKLSAKVTYAREGHAYQMILAATHEVSELGGTIAIQPPAEADSVATAERSTDIQERNELLDNLAPPAKKSGPAPGAKK